MAKNGLPGAWPAGRSGLVCGWVQEGTVTAYRVPDQSRASLPMADVDFRNGFPYGFSAPNAGLERHKENLRFPDCGDKLPKLRAIPLSASLCT